MVSSTHKYLIVTLFLVFIPHLGLGAEIPPTPGELESGSASALGALKDELEGIKTILESIQKELALIRQALPQRPSQPTPPADSMVNVSISGDPMLGSKAALVTLIEFSDYQCPFCRKFFESMMPTLKAEYIDTGKVRYVFRDFPIDRGHPQARKAAEASHCAGEQGMCWEMHDLLFRNQKALQVEQLKKYARSLGIDAPAFDRCLEEGKYAADVQKDYEDGVAAGIQGTPTLFLGKTRGDDAIQGIAIRGAQPVTGFRRAIDRLLVER
jgi:protein-disulfide isomerase